jgi:starch-binding outer membrane protein, SusD/RagB family
MNFKYNTYHAVTLLMLSILFLSGCNDLEENPLSRVTPETSFSNVESLDQTAIAMYAALRGDHDWSNGFGTTQYMTIMYGADDMTTIMGGNKEPFREYDIFVKTSTNEWMPRLWRGCYRAIINANAIIENYGITEGDTDKINNIAGQAHFIRGMSYFYLVRGWGRIPLFTSTYASVDIEKSPEKDVYEQVIDDFLEAERLLPSRQTDVGRPNRGAAKAFLAKAYLTMAGWPVKDPSYYEFAAAKAREVIDNKDIYGFDLLPDFASLWLRAYDNSKESIFSMQYDNNAPDGIHANHIIGTASLPEDIYGGWNDYFTELTFFNDFPEGPRKDATFLTEFYKYNAATKSYDTLDWTQINAKHPYYAKFLDGGFINVPPYTNGFKVAAAYALMRYAEVLLIYAEARAQATGPDDAAYDAVNQVRRRAGLDDLSAGLSQGDFVNAVIDERGWELAAEGQRWFDLIRTEKVGEVVTRRSPEEQVGIQGSINQDNWYATIPEEDVLKNPNLAK